MMPLTFIRVWMWICTYACENPYKLAIRNQHCAGFCEWHSSVGWRFQSQQPHFSENCNQFKTTKTSWFPFPYARYELWLPLFHILSAPFYVGGSFCLIFKYTIRIYPYPLSSMEHIFGLVDAGTMFKQFKQIFYVWGILGNTGTFNGTTYLGPIT